MFSPFAFKVTLTNAEFSTLKLMKEPNPLISLNGLANFIASMYDFVSPKKRKIIEFNGDYWHANPAIYNSGWVNSVIRKSATQIWDSDAVKLMVAKKTKISMC